MEATLRTNGVTTQFSLLGKYLMMKQVDVTPKQHAEAFYTWLCSVTDAHGHGHVATVVHCVSEKMNITFPGIYDATEWSVKQNQTQQYSIVLDCKIT